MWRCIRVAVVCLWARVCICVCVCSSACVQQRTSGATLFGEPATYSLVRCATACFSLRCCCFSEKASGARSCGNTEINRKQSIERLERLERGPIGPNRLVCCMCWRCRKARLKLSSARTEDGGADVFEHVFEFCLRVTLWCGVRCVVLAMVVVVVVV